MANYGGAPKPGEATGGVVLVGLSVLVGALAAVGWGRVVLGLFCLFVVLVMCSPSVWRDDINT